MRTLVPTAVEGRLTQSWRFGSEVAGAANELLEHLRDTMRISGNPALDSTIDRRLAAADATAILTRTNGGALEYVMAAQSAGRTVHLMGDNRYAVQFCDGAEKLMDGRPAGLEDLAAFDTWEAVVQHAEDAPGASDWKVLVKLIEEHGVDALRAALEGVVDERRAEVLVCTAHKAKGREWQKVVLADDLADFAGMARRRYRDSQTEKDRLSMNDELMLGYVAVTRAQGVLNPGILVRTPDTARTLAGVS
ncbi:3'-5' exonuclease [Rhodococcus sp. NPDC003994]